MRSYVYFLFALCLVLGLTNAEQPNEEDHVSRGGPWMNVGSRVKRRVNDMEMPWRRISLLNLLGGLNGILGGGGLVGGAGLGLDRRIITNNIIRLSNRLDTLIAQASNIAANQV